MARNRGWRATTARFVAFTDDDCEPSAQWLRTGLAAFGRDESVGIVQGRTVPQLGVVHRTWTATRDVREASPFFEGCNLLVRREALEMSGGFDERLHMGSEDTSMGWEILSRGWRRAFADSAVVYHDTTDPGPRWHIRQGMLRVNLAAVVKEHPDLRREFWRRWAVSDREGTFALAVVGALGGIVWRPMLLLGVPYMWINRPFSPADVWLKRSAALGLQDVVNVAGMLRGSLRHRVFVV